MKQTMARRLAWSLWGVSVVFLAVNVTVTFVNGWAGDEVNFAAFGTAMTFGYATAGALVASRQPRNPIGWLFLAIPLGLHLTAFSEEYLIYGLVANPGSVPATEWVAWLGTWTIVVAVVPVPLALLLFPTGQVPSRRWRALPALMIGAGALAILGLILKPGALPGPKGVPALPNPTGVEGLRAVAGIASAVAGAAVGLSAVAGVVALFLRYRRSQGDERRQIRLLAYVGMVVLLCLVGLFVSDPLFGSSDFFWMALWATWTVGIPAASGIAILRYRLYDIDVVVRKTAVYALLAAVVTGVYALLVVAIPATLLHPTTTGQRVITIGATALLTLALLPLRRRATRLANRMVYGKRATPYEVLSEFSARIGETYATEDVLPRLARILTEGTGATRADIWLRLGDELRLTASSPADVEDAPRVALAGSDDLPRLPGAGHVYPVRHAGELLGALAVTKPPNDPLRPTEEQLLSDVAAQAGLVLRNVRLTEELKARLVELQDSRKRLVTAQDEERRRIERNIHDGAQQQLVAVGVKLGLARALLPKDPDGTSELLAQLQAENQDALETLRDLARGIYPPLLADAGLYAAISSHARKSAVPVSVEADAVARYPQVEAAVYFSVLEALQNVSKYAGASQATVRLAHADGSLQFEVHDDGAGFDPATTPRGSGLTNMADRLAALGGELRVGSTPAGTTVTGRIPVRPLEPVS